LPLLHTATGDDAANHTTDHAIGDIVRVGIRKDKRAYRRVADKQSTSGHGQYPAEVRHSILCPKGHGDG
jgi:hypothetical protein